MNDGKDEFKELMSSKLFDIEHVLGMYALSFYTLTAENIYDDNLLETLGEEVKKCHIYLIGSVPKVELKDVRQKEKTFEFEFQSLGNRYNVNLPNPGGLALKKDAEFWYFSDDKDQKHGPSDERLMQALQLQHGIMDFNIVYIGQAYGKDGSRSAIDRLKKHETLQKIALKGVPDGYRLQVILLEIEPSNRTYTFINPFAQDTSQSATRIRQGLDKLFGTDEHERITLYEASLIKYFQPHYNKEFKNSFPSTNLKVLADCYDKDFSAIVAEICFDELPFILRSDVVPPKRYHIIQHDLHDAEERKAFFTCS